MFIFVLFTSAWAATEIPVTAPAFLYKLLFFSFAIIQGFWNVKINGKASLAIFLNFLDAVLVLFQCCDWSVPSCRDAQVADVVFRFSDKLWQLYVAVMSLFGGGESKGKDNTVFFPFLFFTWLECVFIVTSFSYKKLNVYWVLVISVQ